MTLFDFNNDGSMDICYQDMNSLRVISPSAGGVDFVPFAGNSSVLFSTTVYSYTAYEAPVIADVNMDGSADIVVVHANNNNDSRGQIRVYEHSSGSDMWAPCPPVWNQGMYDPTQVREDLKINAKPLPMLTPYTKGGETIRPLNGSWIQQPIVTQGANYVPVVRKPDVNILDMTVTVSGSTTTVTLVIRNDGSASINAQTPIAFYNGGVAGDAIGSGATLIATLPVGVDIFPEETVTRQYVFNYNYGNMLIWARITDNGQVNGFPAPGYLECDIINNVFSGTSCIPPYIFRALPDTVLCGNSDNVTLEVEIGNSQNPTYQWYRNDNPIAGATDSVYTATIAGDYKCRITNGPVCRGFTEIKTVTREIPVAVNDTLTVETGTPTALDVLANDTVPSAFCNPLPVITVQPTQGTATVQTDGKILYTPTTAVPCSDSLDYRLYENTARVYITVTPSVIARDDRVWVLENSLNNKIAVTVNDFKLCTADTVIEIITAAKNGQAAVEDTIIKYSPATDYTGIDSIIYRIHCGDPANGADTATVYINAVRPPDNISDATCYTTPPSHTWSIKEENTTLGEISTYAPALVGDLDGDGYPEIVAPYQHGSPVPGSPDGLNVAHRAQKIKIYRGGTFAESDFTTTTPFTPLMTGVIALTRTTINGQDTALIVVAEADLYLRAYNYNGGLVWASNNTWRASINSGTTYNDSKTSVGVADFNGDGNPEIYTGNRIFDASNGHLLCEGTGNKGRSLEPNVGSDHDMTIAADIFGTGRLNLVAGNQVYDVAPNLLSMTVVASVSPPAVIGYSSVTVPDDGLTQVIDIDNDGKLEVVVEHHFNFGQTYHHNIIYVWSPEKQQVLAQKYFPPTTQASKMGVPFMGDIDGDKKPEILFIATDSIYAFKYEEGNPLLQEFWRMTHSDGSAVTGMTLFDFNQDGKAEIVYRDQTRLRIIDGSTSTPQTLNHYDCYSGTGFEYPVVADIDNDGAAEIMIAGNSTSDNTNYNGKLRIFKSGNSEKWAPARKVWNQYAYNVVNVNEDLTIPAVQMTPAMVFPGEDNTPGTADDIRPYNAFLQQATALSTKGTPLWLTPDALFTPVFDHYPDGDSLLVILQITNTGSAALQAPFYVTAYKNTRDAANIMATDSSDVAVNVGDTVSVTITVRNLSNWLTSPELVTIVLSINDKAGNNIQSECNYDNNNIERPISNIPMAKNDTATTIGVTPVKIPVLKNDIIPPGCTSPLSIETNPVHGTVTTLNDSILYTSADPDFRGIDSLTYRITCNGSTSAAKVYITVTNKPDNIINADCFVALPATAWSIREYFKSSEDSLSTYISPIAGDIDGDGIPEILAVKFKSGRVWQDIYVFPGTDRDNPRVIPTVEGDITTFGISMAKLPNGTPIVIMLKGALTLPAGDDGHIHAYNAQTGAQLWVSDSKVTGFLDGDDDNNSYSFQFTDFDSDGMVEIIAGKDIFAAESGIKLLTSTGNGGYSLNGRTVWAPWSADMTGDDKPEYIAGNQVYSVHITDRINASGNTMTLLKSITPPNLGGIDITDGMTQVADFNRDGHLDILVSRPVGTDNIAFYVWDYQNNTILGSLYRAGVTGSRNMGLPFIGNIDENPNLEVLLVVNNKILGWTYLDGQQNAFSQTEDYSYDINDPSGETGITLFDFNQDKVNELVYRGEQFLYILQAETTGTLRGFTEVEKISCMSGTHFEHPIVVDVDNEGSSAIVTVGGTGGTSNPGGYYGWLYIFKSNNTPWAPARKVWNQPQYNVVNINNDLTVPRYPFNPATVFPGVDGIPGNGDDLRPYNNFMQQQTSLSINGTTIWLTPDASVTGTPAVNYHANGDSLVVTLQITNTGDAALSAPFYISAYKNSVDAANKMATDSSTVTVNTGETKPVTVIIRNLSSYTPLTNILISINDRGAATYVQPECSYTNNTLTHPFADILMARNDTATTIGVTPVKIPVLKNDITAGCTIGTPLITGMSANVTAVWNSTNDSIIFTSTDPGFSGVDTITYSIACNGNTSTAHVYIIVYDKPDNIVEQEDCFAEADQFAFGIKEQWHKDNTGDHRTGVLVGDLDGDGLPEIVAYGYVTADNPNSTLAIKVYNGQTGAQKAQIVLGVAMPNGDGLQPVMTAVLVDADRNGMGEIIFILPSTLKIASYEADITGGNFTMLPKWTTEPTFEPPITTGNNFPQPIVADFNGDGVPEVVVYNRIYNAVTGDYLGYTESSVNTAHVGRIVNRGGNQTSNFMTTADFDGDGLPEIAAGGKVYKVSFNADKTAVSCTVWSARQDVTDGFTAVADVNLDGALDVVVVNGTGNPINATRIQIWTPATQAKFADIPVYKNNNNNEESEYQGYPFIGDIDGVEDNAGKKYPEICVTIVNRVNAFKYNSSDQFDLKWQLHTTDPSGGTGITLFDFNNDGINEIVYRDYGRLRALNGVADNTEPVTVDFGFLIECLSGTAFEYPVIADTDGDGSANICVTCYNDAINSTNQLRVYESNATPWAPTRKVWNQVNYEPLQINEDLTVPKYSIPKNTAFAGKYPYNGALIQVPTMVNENFDIVQLAADPAVESIWIEELNPLTNRIWVKIKNLGVRNTNASLPVSLYNTGLPIITGTGLLDTKPAGVIIEPGKTDSMYFDISSAAVTVQMSARIQDDGANFPADGSYLDCDLLNNTGEISGLLAVRDYMIITSNTPVTFNVLDNDFYGACDRGALNAFDTIVNSGLHHGSLDIDLADSTFIYTPAQNFLGVDSFTYYIKCNTDSSAAKVYILVQKPLSAQYTACPNAVVTMGFTAISNVEYNWYADNNGVMDAFIKTKDTIVVVKYNTPAQTYWVQAKYGDILFPPYRVDLVLSDNCGRTDPTGCAVDGTVIFHEDYGGNNETDVERSSTPLGTGTSIVDYNFCNATSGSSCIQGEGNYAITKKSIAHTGTTTLWHGGYSDHTYPNDLSKGYMFMANAGSMPSKFYEYRIDNLCANTDLYFSAWLANLCTSEHATSHPQQTNLKFELTDLNGNVLAVYYTANLPRTSQNTGLVWTLYGFNFNSADNASIIMRIYNNGPGGSGNDFVMDDIEIRLCAPEVEITNIINSDTTVCYGADLNIIGTYVEDGTFGDNLSYRWEFRHRDSVSWKPVAGHFGNITVDCDSPNADDRTIRDTVKITAATKAGEGYYRLLVSASGSSINAVNCRASSDSVHVRVIDKYIAPDIRIQVCPSPPDHQIQLSSFLDSTDYSIIQWQPAPSGYPPLDTGTGVINGTFLKGTYTYRYTVSSPSHSECGSFSAKAYIRVLQDRILSKTDTVVICLSLDQSTSVQLNQIFGLALGGVLEYAYPINPDTTVSSYVTEYTPPSKYAGAYVFNAQKAYNNANGSYDDTYKGTAVKKFEFRYTGVTCVTGSKKIVVIVTP
jgi:hypothetical protein